MAKQGTRYLRSYPELDATASFSVEIVKVFITKNAARPRKYPGLRLRATTVAILISICISHLPTCDHQLFL